MRAHPGGGQSIGSGILVEPSGVVHSQSPPCPAPARRPRLGQSPGPRPAHGGAASDRAWLPRRRLWVVVPSTAWSGKVLPPGGCGRPWVRPRPGRKHAKAGLRPGHPQTGLGSTGLPRPRGPGRQALMLVIGPVDRPCSCGPICGCGVTGSVLSACIDIPVRPRSC